MDRQAKDTWAAFFAFVAAVVALFGLTVFAAGLIKLLVIFVGG